MNIPFKLKASINQYFAFKYATGKHDGIWTAEVKDRCCEHIFETAQRYGMVAYIVPGAIELSRKGQAELITGPLAY